MFGFILLVFFAAIMFLIAFGPDDEHEKDDEPKIKCRYYKDIDGKYVVQKWYPYMKWYTFEGKCDSEEDAKKRIRNIMLIDEEKYIYYDGGNTE